MPEHQQVMKGHQYWWLAGGYDLEIGLLEVASMMVTWWIVAFYQWLSWVDDGQALIRCMPDHSPKVNGFIKSLKIKGQREWIGGRKVNE